MVLVAIFALYNLQAYSVGCVFKSCRVHTAPLLHPPPPHLRLPRASVKMYRP